MSAVHLEIEGGIATLSELPALRVNSPSGLEEPHARASAPVIGALTELLLASRD